MAETGASNLDGLQTIANRVIKPKLNSQLFTVIPTLAVLSGHGGSASDLGRPGVAARLGGTGTLNKVQRQAISDGYDKHIRFQQTKVGGGKYMGLQTTTASTGSDTADKKPYTATFRWCMWQQPVKVRKMVERISQGRARIANATVEATEMAMEELLEQLGTDVHAGSPTSQTDVVWDNPTGLHMASHTTNTYGGVNRSNISGWNGRRVTAATSATLSLVDDANLVQGAMNEGPGVDMGVTTNAIFNTLKQEALGRSGTRIVNIADEMPALAKVGFRREAIQYGNCMIFADPKQTASYLHFLVGRDIFWEVHPSENFRVTNFVDGENLAQGSEDVLSAFINVMYRMYVQHPLWHVLYTNVS